ncbi:glycosyltransferase family 4 protein [Paenibacillus elgii]
MPRRLFVSIDFPPEKGGIQNYVYGLVSNLPPSETFVLTDSASEAKRSETEQFDKEQLFPVYRIGLKTKSVAVSFLHLLRLLYWIIRLKRKYGIREIHFGNVLPVGMGGPLAKLLCNVRYYTYIHGLDALSIIRRKRSYKYVSLLFTLKFANKIVCNSDYTKSKLMEIGIREEQLTIIPPGIEMEEQKPRQAEVTLDALRMKWGLDGKRVILTVARLVERKGHDVTLKALSKLIVEYPDLCYVICGDGPDKERLSKLVSEYGLEPYVRFTGVVDDEELAVLYSFADLFIMPSREIIEKGDVEGYGIVFLEANYNRLPVIAGNSGGIPDAVLDNVTGYLVDPLSDGEIAMRIKSLLDNANLCREMGENGFRWVTENCLWKHRVRLLETI